MDQDRSPGWDKRNINSIAKRDYGGLESMFVAHGWSREDRTYGQIAPTRVVETYGSVEAFVLAHPEMPGLDDILATARPDVWLTSFYGFAPRNWGFLGFTVPWMRDRFLRESRPGALVVVYGASGSAPNDRGKVLGIMQMSHRGGSAQDFMRPTSWADKQANPDRKNKWNEAVQAVRAWKVTPETRPLVRDFAPITFTSGRAQVIGAQGMRIEAEEARNLLSLDLQEVEVFGGLPVEQCVAGPAAEILKPSRAGPVSKTGRWVREAEGPKHLYILRLDGNGEHFLGEPIGDRMVVKIGMSRSPDTRCDDHNRTLPKCAFAWSIERSTFHAGRPPFSSSRPALAGEQAMKDHLDLEARSLGGEFFLVSAEQIEEAWRIGVAAAEMKESA